MDDKTIRLVKKARAGNRRALNKLLRGRYEKLYRIAYSYMKNESDALDVIQEATIRIMTKISQLQQESYFDTWMIRILINECQRALGKKQRSLGKQIISDELAQLPDERIRITQQVENSELLNYLSLLRPGYEEVLLLYYYNEMTVSEISQLLSVNENTVKTRLARGRQELKVILERSGFQEK